MENNGIGLRIKDLRHKAGLSQTDLAKLIGVSKQNLYKYENGIITNIPSDKIEALAHVLNTTPAYLMGWDETTIDLEAQGIGKGAYLIEYAKRLYELYQKADPKIQKAVDSLLKDDKQ